MHAPMKYVEKGLAIAANGIWQVFSTANKIKQNPSFIPRWSDKPLLKSYQKTKPPLGWPRETDSLCPDLHARGAAGDPRRQEGRQRPPQREGRRDQGDHHRARRQDPDGQGLPHPRPLRRRDGDRHRRSSSTSKRSFPGRDIRAHNDEKLHNHGSSTVLHGRGSVLTVDLTNRCNMMCDPCFMDANQVGFVHELTLGGHQAGARQRHHDQAAPPDVGAVLGRRADDVAVLPRRGPLRAQGRLQQRAGGDQRHRVRQEPRVRQGRGRSRPALRLPAVRRHRQRRQLAPPRRQPVRRQAARDREPAQRRRRHRAGHHDRQRRQQRAGRPRHRVRARQPEEDQLPVVPAGVVHRPRRGDHAGAPRRAALHAVAPRARREEPDRHRRADPRLVPDLVHVHLHRLGRRRPRAGPRVGPAHLRLPPELRHRHGA